MKIIKKLNFKNNVFIFNTFLIVISGFIVKILGLTNKIFITRLLGTEGMTLYVLAFPTIILFISLASFSLNVTTSKLIAEGLITKKYSPKKILKASINLALKTAFVIETLFLLIISFLVNNLLKTPNLFYPLLMTAFLIPIVGITDTLRGVFSGYQKMKTVALVNIIEQVSRMLFSILGIIILSKYGIIIAVSSTILALSIGELASMIYLIVKIKKLSLENYETENNEKKAVWEMAFPTTISRLIGSFTYFLEPILNTFILIYLGYNKKIIDFDYTVINAYIIPMLTICVFLSNALSTTAVPAISEKASINETTKTFALIDKIFFLSLVPGVIITILLYNYPKDFLNLFFSTTVGHSYIKKYVIVFLFHYIQSPGIAILQALGKSKQVLLICSIFNILKLMLIIALAFIPFIGSYTLFYAIIIVMVMETFTIWFFIYKIVKYVPNNNTLFNLLIISIFIFVFTLFLNLILSNFIIKSVLICIFYLFLIIKFKILHIKAK